MIVQRMGNSVKMEWLLGKGKPIKKTERQFINELYLSTADDIYKLAYRKTNNHHASEDIKQNVFITLLTKIKTVYNHPDPVGWIYQTTYFQIEHYWRYMGRKLEMEVDLSSSVGEIADNTETQEERQMLVWFYAEGYSLLMSWMLPQTKGLIEGILANCPESLGAQPQSLLCLLFSRRRLEYLLSAQFISGVSTHIVP